MNLLENATLECSNNPEIIHYVVAHWNVDEGIVMPGWYFWDETYATRYGPYITSGWAQRALDNYCHDVLGYPHD